MKVVQLKAAKAAIERQKYKELVLSTLDKMDSDASRQRREQKAEVERKARKAL